MTPTEEQLAILEAVRSTKANLLIEALAGAAKTSTLVLIAKATATIPTLALSFNASIAKEMKERLPGNCESLTINSIGHRAWAKFIGRRLIVNKDKVYNLLRAEVDRLSGEDRASMFECFTETMKAIERGKVSGYVPDGAYPDAKRLISDEELFDSMDEAPSELQEMLIRTVSSQSIKLAFSGDIDFNDQVLLPAIFPASFTQYPQVLLDEAQDLSRLNHVLVKKIARQRLIAVGDDCQAIYAFRGAHSNSMSLLKETFSMTSLVLSISFRCPTSVVKAAQWRAPHMRWPEWAKEGTVRSLPDWSPKDIPDGAVILCRNNAPLFATALRLLRNGRYPELVGADIGKTLLKIMKGLGHLSMSRDDLISAITKWKTEKLDKSRDQGKIIDQADCMMVFAEAGTNLADAIAYAEHIFQQSGPIKLMTGHKSKGLEFEDIFILDKGLCNLFEGSQDRNLLYVMQTRAKNSLTYIDSEKFHD